jgi:hypothetical protein
MITRSYGAKLDDPGKQRFSAVRLAPIELPDSVDYSYGFRIDNQKALGTCVSFGTRKLFDFYATKRTGKPVTCSARAIYSAAKSEFEQGDTSDDGLAVSDGLTIATQFYVNESDWPSTDCDSEDDFPQWILPVPASIKRTDFLLNDIVRLAEITDEQMQIALHAHGPLCIGTSWLDSWEEIGTDGILPVAGNSVGGHCVDVVSYARNFRGSGKTYYKIANNWDTDYGDAGFVYMEAASLVNLSDAYTVKALKPQTAAAAA